MDKYKAHSHKYEIGDKFYYGHDRLKIVGYTCGRNPSAHGNTLYDCICYNMDGYPVSEPEKTLPEEFMRNLEMVIDHDKEREKREQEKRELEQKVSFYREKLIEHLSSLLVTADNEHDEELIRQTIDSVIIHIKMFAVDCTEGE